MVEIPLTGLTPPHTYAFIKPGLQLFFVIVFSIDLEFYPSLRGCL